MREVLGLNSVLNYLDDFLVVGLPGERTCSILLAMIELFVFENFGVPLALIEQDRRAHYGIEVLGHSNLHNGNEMLPAAGQTG